MAQSTNIPTVMLLSMDELRDGTATLQQIRKDTSITESSLALDYIADKLIELTNTVERREQHESAKRSAGSRNDFYNIACVLNLMHEEFVITTQS